MTRLLLGPLLRHVGARDATVWVETDGPADVEVLGFRERTWTVAGHHYAVVVVAGLEPGTSTPYEVRLDGEVAWPSSPSTWPASRIRTLGPGQPTRIVFGSCRDISQEAGPRADRSEPDVLAGYAVRLASTPDEQWPQALLLVGDQVYADKTSRHTRRRIPLRTPVVSGPS